MKVAAVTKKHYFIYSGVAYKLSAIGQSGGGRVAVTEVKTGHETYIKGSEDCYVIDPEDYVEVEDEVVDEVEDDDEGFDLVEPAVNYINELEKEYGNGSNDCSNDCGCEDNTEEQLDSDTDGEPERKPWWNRGGDGR